MLFGKSFPGSKKARITFLLIRDLGMRITYQEYIVQENCNTMQQLIFGARDYKDLNTLYTTKTQKPHLF